MENTKKCCTCKKVLPISEFNWKNKIKQTFQYQCKICQRASQNAFYNNTPEYRKSIIASNKRRKIDIKIKYLDFLKTQKCLHCGISNPVVLTFDHLNPETKIMCVSQMVQGSYSWKQIKEEMAKCQILCFNCHAIKTARDQKWYENWKHVI